MRFVDKLEQKGASKSGLNIQKEAAKFRQQLIDVCKFSPSLCIQRTLGLHGVSFWESRRSCSKCTLSRDIVIKSIKR